MNRILVTGGAGYIGSHQLVELLNTGCAVAVLDNLSNSSVESLRRVKLITGRDVEFIQGDMRDEALLTRIFAAQPIDAVMHFAGLKSVSESVAHPLDYLDNNVGGTIKLCRAMSGGGVFRLVFSSSATVYGEPARVPISEEFPTCKPANAYGASKLMVEEMLRALPASDDRWSIAVLRYFNPVGAHESGLIGEDPHDTPNNLVPYISQVAVGRLPCLSMFGDDYPTVDGTGVRDYIHVQDLVRGHLKALAKIADNRCGFVWNLGAGRGYSVREVVHAFEKASGRRVPCKIGRRRPGDIAECWSDPSRAEKELGWKAEYDLNRMMVDAWRWQSMNPNGYRGQLGLDKLPTPAGGSWQTSGFCGEMWVFED